MPQILTLSSLSIFVYILTIPPVAAQLALFSGISFEHEVNPRYGYELQVENRQIIETGEKNRMLLIGALNFSLADNLDIAPAVRLIPSYGSDDPTELRLQLDLNYSYPLGDGPFALEGRLRNQYERDLVEGACGHKYAVRPRIGLAYSIFQHTELVLEYEARYRFDTRNEFERHRYTLGFSQGITTRIQISGFYRIEQRTNIGPVNPDPFIGLYFNYVLPDARKRDWRYRRPFGRSLDW